MHSIRADTLVYSAHWWERVSCHRYPTLHYITNPKTEAYKVLLILKPKTLSTQTWIRNVLELHIVRKANWTDWKLSGGYYCNSMCFKGRQNRLLRCLGLDLGYDNFSWRRCAGILWERIQPLWFCVLFRPVSHMSFLAVIHPPHT